MPHRGRAGAVRQRLRVRGQGGRRRGAAPVHPVGGEGRARPAGAGGAGRLPDGGRPGHPVRRQGALGGLLRHGLPEGRQARPAGRRGKGEGAAAGAGGRAVRAGRRRLRGRGHVRPVLAARPGAGHRAGRLRRAHPGQGGGARSWRSPGTRSTCARCRTAPGRSAAVTCATSRCPATWPTRWPPPRTASCLAWPGWLGSPARPQPAWPGCPGAAAGAPGYARPRA